MRNTLLRLHKLKLWNEEKGVLGYSNAVPDSKIEDGEPETVPPETGTVPQGGTITHQSINDGPMAQTVPEDAERCTEGKKRLTRDG